MMDCSDDASKVCSKAAVRSSADAVTTVVALEARLAAALTSLPADHRPPIVLISDKPFSVLDGELTSNLKVRRQAVEQRFEPRIAAALSQFGDPGEAGRNPVVVW